VSSLRLTNREETLIYCMRPADGCHDGQRLEDVTQRERVREHSLLSLKKKLRGKSVTNTRY